MLIKESPKTISSVYSVHTNREDLTLAVTEKVRYFYVCLLCTRTQATCHGDNRDLDIGFDTEYFVGTATVMVISTSLV
jgi:hypothetical protein